MSRTQTRNAGARQERREAGDARNIEWRAKTLTDQVRALDVRLGTGVGAKRQRAKLHAILHAPEVIERPVELKRREHPVAEPEVFASKSEEKRIKMVRKDEREHKSRSGGKK